MLLLIWMTPPFEVFLILGDLWAVELTVTFEAKLEVCCMEVQVSRDSDSAACTLSLAVCGVDQEDR